MTSATLQIIARQIKNPSFVPPIADFQLGRLMFRASRDITECTTDEMVHGCLSAKGNGARLVHMMKVAVN